jgi:hypothetical protein
VVEGQPGAIIAGWLLLKLGFVLIGGIGAAIINVVIGAVILLAVIGFFKKKQPELAHPCQLRSLFTMSEGQCNRDVRFTSKGDLTKGKRRGPLHTKIQKSY